MINKNKALWSITLFTSLSLSTALTSAQSLSEAIFKNVAGKRFWQVQVNCGSTKPSQQLNQDVTTEQWCINGSTDCFTDQQQAAEEACNGFSSSNVEGQEKTPEPLPLPTPPSEPTSSIPSQNLPTPAALEEDDDDDDYEGDEQNINYDALRKEKIELQAKRLEIQQQILELKRQEIELQKLISGN